MDSVAKKYIAMRVPKRYPAMETCFGTHSQKSIEESIFVTDRYSADEPYAVSPDKANHVHHQHQISQNSDELKSYTTNSLHINSALHKHYGERYDKGYDASGWHASDSPRDHLRDAVELDKQLQNHQASEDFHVYTGLPYSPFRHAMPDSGNHMLHLPAFTSTSTNFKKALYFSEMDLKTDHDAKLHGDKVESYSRHVLKLHVPKGTQIASVRHLSKNPEEDELLMNRGYDIAVNPIPIRAKGETNSPVYVWSATVVKRRPKPINTQSSYSFRS